MNRKLLPAGNVETTVDEPAIAMEGGRQSLLLKPICLADLIDESIFFVNGFVIFADIRRDPFHP